MKQSGFFWHIHHDTLCEYSANIQKRIDYVKKNKPEDEIPTRLRLLMPVLHPKRLPSKWVEAYQKWVEADQKWVEADQKWVEADEKWVEADEKYLPKIEVLHKEEHPNCPWNGSTIFP